MKRRQPYAARISFPGSRQARDGNLTYQTTSNVTKTFNYDPFDRMTSVVRGQSTLQSMTYSPDSKRLSLTDSSGTRKFFYDGNDVIQEYNSNWSTVRKEHTWPLGG